MRPTQDQWYTDVEHGDTNKWAKGNCADLDIETADKVFFSDKRGRPKKNPEHHDYCGTCPIKNFCLANAIVYGEEGVWGDTTKSQRDYLLEKSEQVDGQPKLFLDLLAEAKRQGWYQERPSVEQILARHLPVPSPQKQPVEILESLEASPFQFDFETEFLPQTPSASCIPQESQSGASHSPTSPNGQRESSNEFRFDFELS